MTLPYWHDPEWRALLLAVVAEPDDEVRVLRCADWLEERGENAAVQWKQPWTLTKKWSATSADWYSSSPVAMCAWCQRDGYDPACVRCVQDGERVYPCKELAWTMPIREVVFVDEPCPREVTVLMAYGANNPAAPSPSVRSEIALGFARGMRPVYHRSLEPYPGL